MTYYSTLFQQYRVDDAVLGDRTRRRAVEGMLAKLDSSRTFRQVGIETAFRLSLPEGDRPKSSKILKLTQGEIVCDNHG